MAGTPIKHFFKTRKTHPPVTYISPWW